MRAALLAGLTLLGRRWLRRGSGQGRDDSECRRHLDEPAAAQRLAELRDGYTPQVAIIDGTVTFKGALKGTFATSDVAFTLDGPTFSAFRPILLTGP
jgi:hypothetical protein